MNNRAENQSASFFESSSSPQSADFDAIETTLLESEAGRRFLADYLERNRSEETILLLEALTKLEAVSREQPCSDARKALRGEIGALGKAIALTRRGIAGLAAPEPEELEIGPAAAGLDAIAIATQRATDHIMSAAEIIRNISGALSEQGADESQIAALDRMASDLGNVSSFRASTDSRIEKVQKILEILESRIAWLADSEYFAEASPATPADAVTGI